MLTPDEIKAKEEADAKAKTEAEAKAKAEAETARAKLFGSGKESAPEIPDVTPEFLREWNEFKQDMGWKPRSQRAAAANNATTAAAAPEIFPGLASFLKSLW